MQGKAQDLIGFNLDGYTVQQLHVVYSTDEDGRRKEPMGYFRDEAIAKAWGPANHNGWGKPDFATVLVVTNGARWFLFAGEEISLHGDEQAALEVRQRALAKLTPEEKAVLKL